MRSPSSQPRTSGRGPSDGPDTAEGAYPEGFPQVFGKYVLVRPMARGGMGELFLAAAGETGGFEKLCVVKKVLHSIDDAAVHRRFLDEAKVVVRLNHANLVQVFDAGRVDREYYLAMELVEGKDLRAVWNRCAQLHRRIPVDIAIFVVREVLRGLDYVHDAMNLDLVHRDISPPNILLGYRGEVKLTDFGLAKSAIKREMTSPGVVFGRYSYLSPEQARGLPADRRTDIYACGIVLWELLTGRQLFPSSNRSHQEALSAVRNPKVTPPSQIVPGVPAGIDEALARALAKDRDRRFANAGEFRAALSEVLARDFPTCDTDRASEFMRDIFARECKLEARDYMRYSAQDFSDLRARSEKSEAISISDIFSVEAIEPKKGGDRSTLELGDSDIVELDQAALGQPVSTKSLRESAREWVGKVVAQRYRVDNLIGIGGMGAVFRATHLALGKQFALKVLHSVYTRDSDIISRFMREARAATQTGHPNIIDVLDIGTTDDGEVYFVMELLEGDNLGVTIQNEGPLAVRRAVHIARQICRALEAAHEVGIIHRDLKSENILLTARGKDPDFVKVLDFGICKHMNADSSTTSPGLVIGSPDYMAPEQGAGLEATVASDIYSVGCILFEMLTGRLPFEGRNAVDVLMQKGAHAAVRVTKYRPEVPEALAGVVAHCLERRPSDRPPSMRALEYELTRAVDGRANAVAAVLGIGAGADAEHAPRAASDEPSPGASASMHRAAIAAAEPARVPHRDRAQVAAYPLPTGSVPPVAAARPRRDGPAKAVARALFYMTLGGGVVAGVLFASDRFLPATNSEPAAVATAEAPADGKAHASAQPGPDLARPAPSVEQPATPPSPPQPPPDEVVPEEPTPQELVAMAERAIAASIWTEPAERSLSLALSKLMLIDPTHEAIARLRQAAAEDLMPTGNQALERRQWAEAAQAFRNLVRVWPEHAEARAGLVEALYGQAKIQRRYDDHEAALATADELLNIVPGDFEATLLRAEMLAALGYWHEAKEAYALARKEKPRHARAKKGYWEAVRQIRKLERESQRDNG